MESVNKLDENGNDLTFFHLQGQEEYINGPCSPSSLLFFAKRCKIEGTVNNPKDTSLVIVRNIVPSLSGIQYSRVRKEYMRANEPQLIMFKAYPSDSFRVAISFAGIKNKVYQAFFIPKSANPDSSFLQSEEEINYRDFLHGKFANLKNEFLVKGYNIENCTIEIQNADMIANSFFIFVNNKYGERFKITVVLKQKIKMPLDLCDNSIILNCEISELGVKAL